MPKTTSKEGVTCIKNDEGELVAVIYKDTQSKKNIFYSCKEMDMTELEEMVGSDTVKI